jgi:hypothetical protein
MSQERKWKDKILDIIGKHTTKSTAVMVATPHNVEVDTVVAELVVRDMAVLISTATQESVERERTRILSEINQHEESTEPFYGLTPVDKVISIVKGENQ